MRQWIRKYSLTPSWTVNLKILLDICVTVTFCPQLVFPIGKLEQDKCVWNDYSLYVMSTVSNSVKRCQQCHQCQQCQHCIQNSVNSVRRGVRSDAQLSSTETRFQKCSQSGKNGSKHPMLSTSMADNVISYTKIKRNTKKNKNADKSRVIMLQSTLGN